MSFSLSVQRLNLGGFSHNRRHVTALTQKTIRRSSRPHSAHGKTPTPLS